MVSVGQLTSHRNEADVDGWGKPAEEEEEEEECTWPVRGPSLAIRLPYILDAVDVF